MKDTNDVQSMQTRRDGQVYRFKTPLACEDSVCVRRSLGVGQDLSVFL